MKKRFVSLLSVIISCVILFSSNTTVFASGYGDGGGVVRTAGVTEYTERGEYTGGLHRFVATETAKNLLVNGETEYKIVYSASAEPYVSTAVSEFAGWFMSSTGATISRETDDVAVYSPTAKYISIGNNAYTTGAGVTKPAELKTNGYVIKTVGESIIVLGGSSLGTLFGVYGLLNHLVNLEFYGSDSYYADTNVRNIKLFDYDVVDNPDVNSNIAAFGNIYYKALEAHRLGYSLQYEDVWMYSSQAFHNSMYFLDPGKYGAEHAGWFTGFDTRNDQLCYTAHGDPEEYKAMVKAMVEEIKPYILAEPEKTVISITQQDNTGWCTCSACQAKLAQYGSKSSTQVLFMNDVCKEIYDWLAEVAPGREDEVKIAMFAYHATMQPPTKGNLRLADNAMIYIAPYGAMEFTLPLEDEDNSSAKALFDGWARVADHMGVWGYQTFYDNYLVPLNNWGALQDQWKSFAEGGAFVVFNQGQQNNTAPTGFSSLKVYLNAKFGRNANLDPATLIDNFFEVYFGKKDGYMRKYYEELDMYMRNLRETGIHGKSLYQSAVGASLFPYKLLARWTEYCEKAIEEVSALKTTDRALYNTVVNHIKVESLMPRYFIARFHVGYYNKTEQAEIRRQFALDCMSLGLDRDSEGSTISNLIAGWL